MEINPRRSLHQVLVGRTEPVENFNIIMFAVPFLLLSKIYPINNIRNFVSKGLNR
jgi:hypothetical protein